MIFDHKIGSVREHQAEILQFLTDKKAGDPSFTVLDVGGSASGWTSHVTNAIMDIHPPAFETSVRTFAANFNKQDDWNEVLDYVEKNGKFSFAICSHTLEDIANPTLAMDMMPRIASAGYIAVPSKYRELSHVEGRHRGYFHHRWIYNYKDGKFVGFPKLSFLEYETKLHVLANTNTTVEELCFKWTDSINYEIINNDYMGPGFASARVYFRDLLD